MPETVAFRMYRWRVTDRTPWLVVACLVTVCAFAQVTSRQAREAEKNGGLSKQERFEGIAVAQTKGGRTKQIHATIHSWSIAGGKQLAEFPEHGFLLVQLLGGRVTTVIDGKEAKRADGDFWVVPARAKMSVRVTGESAMLEVVSLSLP